MPETNSDVAQADPTEALEGEAMSLNANPAGGSVSATSLPRDETAFSVDPFTGAPVATGKQHRAATEAMVQLGVDGDEDAYHRSLRDEPTGEA